MEVIKVGDDKLGGVRVVLSPVEIGALYTAINAKVEGRLTLVGMTVLEKFVGEIIENCELGPLLKCSK